MIINEIADTAIIVGDIQSNNVSIDTNNIGFITQLLSTNLYSSPIDSFLREIVSNAWDSHVEAGNDSPILLELGTDTEDREYCRIQDFGVGLSPDRFDNIYRSIGSSTKRSDNTQIGGFGIGRFAALAYSDNVYITSNYLGTKYKYLMYKDGNNIKIDNLFESKTEDKDGLEVMVYVRKGDILDFKDSIKNQLAYFENLYVSFDRLSQNNHTHRIALDFVKSFNNLKIKRYNHFSVNSFSGMHKTNLCLGKIQYPLVSSFIKDTRFKFGHSYPITVNFEIGELEVTPNREQILYSKRNIKIISDKLDLAQDELDEIIKEQSVFDFKDFNDYIERVTSGTNKISLLDAEGVNVSFNTPTSGKSISYLGVVYDSNLPKLYSYVNNNIGNYLRKYIKFRVDGKKLFSKIDNMYIYPLRNLVDTESSNHSKSLMAGRIYIHPNGPLNNISKDYIRNKCLNGTYFVKEISYRRIIRVIIKMIKDYVNNNMYKSFDYDKTHLKIVIKQLFKDLSLIQRFENSSVPKEFKDSIVKTTKPTSSVSVPAIDWSEELNLFILRESDKTNYNGISVTADSRRVQLSDFKKKWNRFPVIYSEKNDLNLRELFWIFNKANGSSYYKYKFVEIAPTKIKKLEQFKNFIKIEDFMNVEYKRIRMLATARYLKNNYPHILELNERRNSLKEISSKLYEVVVKLSTYIQENSMKKYYYNTDVHLYNDIDDMCEKHNYYDEEMMGYMKEHSKLIDNAKFITLFRDFGLGIDPGLINFAVDYALARKLFLPNADAVNRLKEESIFNNKIKKENNETN